MNNNVMQVPKICEECGKEYLPTSNRQRYCPTCGPAAKHRNHIERCRNYHYSHYNYRGYNQAGSNNVVVEFILSMLSTEKVIVLYVSVLA